MLVNPKETDICWRVSFVVVAFFPSDTGGFPSDTGGEQLEL